MSDDDTELQGAMEELSFGNSATPPKSSHVGLRVFAIVLAVVLVLGGGGTGGYLWLYHWRRIPITVNKSERLVRVDSTIASLLKDNDNFDAKPGRLLDITGGVIDQRGGEAVQVERNGQTVSPEQRGATGVEENDAITVTSGKDLTEGHRVRYETVPYDTDIDLTHGPLQEVKQQGKDGKREVWVGERSNKEADKGVTQEPQKLVVQSRTPRPAEGKVIALTFDDGPSQYSGAILDILKSTGVKATFFNLGKSASQYPNETKRMLSEGHQVASHSNAHPYLPKMGRDEMLAELKAGFDNLKAAGVDTKVLRAPYGAFGVEQWKAAADLMDMNVLWDIDTEDWKRPGAGAIHDTVLNNAHNGAIVLMHDGGGDRSQDIEALPRIIDDLKAQGYTFATIDQLKAM